MLMLYHQVFCNVFSTLYVIAVDLVVVVQRVILTSTSRVTNVLVQM